MIDTEKNNSIIDRKNMMIVYKAIRRYKPMIDRVAIIGTIYNIVLMLKKPTFIYNLYKLLCMRIGDYSLYIKKALIFLGIATGAVVLLCLVLTLAIFIERLLWDRQLKKCKGDNRFEQSALRYMREKGSPHCFLVSGEWGSGKTYEVNDFLNKYYLGSNVNTYRVSCFGLSTRSEVIEEINRTIDRSDDSLYKAISELTEYIPVVGSLVSKLISRVYSYDKAKKGSIFIFDDFERITSRTFDNTQLLDYYEKNSFLKRRLNRSGLDDLGEIAKEFEKIEKAFNRLRNEKVYNTDRIDFDKYIAIAGLINELIETYRMKVFIICNTDVIGEKFIHDVLRSKLNCIEYRKVTTNAIRESVINQLINDTVFEDSKKQAIIVDFIKSMPHRLNNAVIERTFGNLRLFSGLFEALINEVTLIDNKYLTKDFLESLFQSIYLTHLLYYNNDLSMLELFENGMNIAFQLRLYNPYRKNAWIMEMSNEYRWVDLALSGHWILNLSKPVSPNSIIKQWKEYEYSELEKNLITDYSYIEKTDKYTLRHLLFIQQVFGKDANWDYKKAINNVLEGYDLTRIDTIQSILDTANALMSNPINSDFYNELFRALRKGNAEGEIIGNGYIYELYRSTVDGKTVHEYRGISI